MDKEVVIYNIYVVYNFIYIYYSAIKKKEILPYVTTWMDPEDIMLSEISQLEKNKYRMISLMCGIQKQQQTKKNKLIDAENRLVVARGGGWGLDEVSKCGQKAQTSSYKINKSRGCNVQNGDYS